LKQHISQHIDHPIGHPLENVFPIWQQNIQEVRHKQNLHIQFASDRTGEERIYDLTIKPLFNRARRYIGRVFVSWDITEQVNVQIEKHRAELLRSFIENTHHEFRTGLTSIANSAYLIRRGSRVEERIDIIGETVQEMTNMVDKMLELVAIDHTQSLKFEAVDINRLVRGMIETFHTAYERKGQTIHIQERHNLPTVQGDVDKLNAALSKIVHNAIRFTPKGGTIQIETRQKANTVIVQISDSGIGMDELTQQRLFERFYRADTAHSTRGFGLGLPIAKHIIDAHSGQIIVNSTLGQGSTFEIVLPIESPISDGSNNRAAPAQTESQSGYDHP
jgi:two-component system phosphate regulon sensor histidine kinase PhoR